VGAAHAGAAIVDCYEPGPDAFACLATNTQTKPSVRLHQAAVVGVLPSCGKVDLYLHGKRSTRNSLLPREIGSGEPLENHVSVDAIRIDEVLADGCDLLKIDCEGAEFDVLAHVSNEALSRAKRIVLEFYRTAGDPDVIIDRLRSAGFDAKIVESRPDFGVIGATRR